MKLYAICMLGLRECLRQRMLYGLLLLTALLIFMGRGCDPATLKGSTMLLDQSGLRTISMQYALHLVTFFCTLISIVLGSQLVVRDVEEDTIMLTISRPVHRMTLLGGRLLAIMVIVATLMALLGALFAGLFYRQTQVFEPRFVRALALVLPVPLLAAMLACAVSLLLNRMMAVMVCLLVYLVSFWSALPWYVAKIRMVWEPSSTVAWLHRGLPPLGDLQLHSAACISAEPATTLPPMVWLSAVAYAVVLGLAMRWLLDRRIG